MTSSSPERSDRDHPAEQAGPAAGAALVCATCGRLAEGDARAEALLTWSRGTDAGRTTWTCQQCSRQHVRSIEGKLDPAWW